MKKHKHDDMLNSAIRELQFSRLQTEHYASILGEIESLTKDGLILALIENAKERHVLDISCHYRSLNK